MGPNQFFGEVELLSGGQTIASVRASETSTCGAGRPFNRHTVFELMKESPLTEEALAQDRPAAPGRKPFSQSRPGKIVKK